ncbi:LamG domain-containing protein [Aestuariibaculum sediminum]|uniref:LamG-like jellyroll fold domain-containing protein n=1 Tax=Aestuariibaculum sediminum TaxID=2770637 RepID=A0A8J6U7W2_9FLAO|nr:LamG-like jellyroll fold domain-containing protein [Aestuariibaculum sediminum]MBD0832513.1 hypothetical protein [Aestuariibaculum sediminum]
MAKLKGNLFFYFFFITTIIVAQTSVDSLKVFEKLKFSYYATAEINGEALQSVSWKEYPGKKTTDTFFSNSKTLTPQKRGFWFTPDIFDFNSFKADSIKVFSAVKYEIKDKLNIFLPLNKKTNAFTNSNAEYIYKHIAFVNDSKLGKVASFNGTSSYIDLRSGKDDIFEELTISAWIKPKSVAGIQSIVGKGKVFSAKIFDGNLIFTTPSIKDHSSKSESITKNVWSHIAYVYLPNNEIDFYVNGNKVSTIKASGINQTNHSILIGSNIWGENYKGLMSNFALWQRALSDDEIKQVYTSGIPIVNNDSNVLLIFILIGVGVLLLVLTLYLSIKKKRHVKTLNSTNYEALKRTSFESKATTLKPVNYSIVCLGGFRVTNSVGENITHKFSPKRTELLLCLILFTLKEDGITSKKMGEVLWPGFSAAQAKNNRSTQIKEIRNIFKELKGISVVYEDKKWKIFADEPYRIDLFHLKKLLPNLFSYNKKEHEMGDIWECLSILKHGQLLPNFNMDWIDIFKSKFDNFILEYLTPFLVNEKINDDKKMELCEVILIIDALHEEAVNIKVNLLIKQGKHMSAQKVSEHFYKLYEQYYGEPYSRKVTN